MNRIFLTLITILTFSLSAFAQRDITTTDGGKYSAAVVTKVTASTISIVYKDGAATLQLAKLPVELQKEFHYTPPISTPIPIPTPYSTFAAHNTTEELRPKTIKLYAPGILVTPWLAITSNTNDLLEIALGCYTFILGFFKYIRSRKSEDAKKRKQAIFFMLGGAFVALLAWNGHGWPK